MTKNRAIVAVIDAAHARIYSYGDFDETGPRLGAEQDLTSPGRQAHGQFADHQGMKPGIVGYGGNPSTNRGGATHRGGHGSVDDHRQDHLSELDTRFARDILAAIETRAKGEDVSHVILVAGPQMLGTLRTESADLRKHGFEVSEVDANLSYMSVAQIQDHLARHDVVGARLRQPPARAVGAGPRA